MENSPYVKFLQGKKLKAYSYWEWLHCYYNHPNKIQINEYKELVIVTKAKVVHCSSGSKLQRRCTGMYRRAARGNSNPNVDPPQMKWSNKWCAIWEERPTAVELSLSLVCCYFPFIFLQKKYIYEGIAYFSFLFHRLMFILS